MSKLKLQSGFDPIWKSDMLDLKKMSKTAFVLRQIYRLYRDPTTNTCNLSDVLIQQLTGWNRQTIAKARKELINLREIFPQGYHTFLIKDFKRWESCTESVQPQKTDLNRKCATGCTETVHQLHRNHSSVEQKLSTPIYTEQKQNNTERDFKKSSLDVNASDMVCLNCQNYEKRHVDSRGDSYGYCPILVSKLPPYLNAQACANFVKKKQKRVKPAKEVCNV